MMGGENKVLRQYYTETDFFASPEGILKVLSFLACLCAGSVVLGGSACAAAVGVSTAGASLCLSAAAALALLCAGALLSAPLLAPTLWLYTDLMVSSALGILLLVSAVLDIIFCSMTSVANYFNAPLSLLSAVLVTASAVTTYRAVMRRWDAARGPAREPTRLPPEEHEQKGTPLNKEDVM